MALRLAGAPADRPALAEQVLNEMEALVAAALPAHAREMLKTSLRQIANLGRPTPSTYPAPALCAGLPAGEALKPGQASA